MGVQKGRATLRKEIEKKQTKGSKYLLYSLRNENGTKVGLEGRSTGSSTRGSVFNSQHPPGVSQLSATPALVDPTPSSGLSGYNHVCGTQTYM